MGTEWEKGPKMPTHRLCEDKWTGVMVDFSVQVKFDTRIDEMVI